MQIWLNGKLTSLDQARISPDDRGFLLGDGIFETMAAHHGLLPFIDRHIENLTHAAHVTQIPMPYSEQQLTKACGQVLEANSLGTGTRAALRLTVSRGAGSRGLAPPDNPKPTILITATTMPAPPAGVRLMTSTIRRNEHSPIVRLKTLNYMDNILAKLEAQNTGADDALMLNMQGHVTATTSANIFMLKADALTTPPPSDGCRPGIMRGLILERAMQNGLATKEKTLEHADLFTADALFVCNSLIGLCPVTQLDRTILNSAAHAEKLIKPLDLSRF